MAQDPRLRRLLGRARRALGDHRVPDAVEKLRAIVGADIPASETQAQSAWEKLRNGDAPTAEELQALEIVIRLLRPALLSIAGQLEDLPDQQGRNLYPQALKDQWSAFRDKVKPFLYSIGRVERKDGTRIGTGFLVADRVLATNRHVLDELTFGTGVLGAGAARVVFQGEDRAPDRPEHIVEIQQTRKIHPTLDIVLLDVDTSGRPAPSISVTPPVEGERVAAIGYPAKDATRNPLFITSIFRGRFDVKRASLGEVLDGSVTPNLFHDCSTLGGNSGSPVFSLETGAVIGIHRAGFFMYRNEALDAASLKQFALP
jgi:hypothetical protein